MIEDNILYQQCPGIECDAGCTGNAFLYNFAYESEWMPGTSSQEQEYDFDANHAPHGCMNLYEGNYGANWMNDGYHGSGSHMTVFRNRFHGANPISKTNSVCIMLNRWSLYNNIVGNVLGATGVTNVYDEKVNGYDNTTCLFRC